jgi:hypothetical protein
MDETPAIEIFGCRVVHLDRCQVGHICDTGGMWRFWFWPEYDSRRAEPVTGDLSECLHDRNKLQYAVRGAILTAIARTPNMSYRGSRHIGQGVGVPRRPFESYATWLARKKALKDARIIVAGQ